MKGTTLIFLFLLSAVSLSGADFITEFLNTCVEEKRPVSNVNIGKPILEKMASNTNDEELKKKARQNKALVDEISATIILQGYMESKRMK